MSPAQRRADQAHKMLLKGANDNRPPSGLMGRAIGRLLFWVWLAAILSLLAISISCLLQFDARMASFNLMVGRWELACRSGSRSAGPYS
jgi:hypothetical protein